MRLKELRKQHKLTQQEVANKLDLKLMTYNGYENGNRELPNNVLINLSKFYNVSTDYILECNNQFDIGFLDQETKELIKQIKLLNKEQKDRLSGYLEAMLQDTNKYNKEFNNFKDNF